MLPSPRQCYAIVIDCGSVLSLLLLLAGDVEENPGPTGTRATASASDEHCDLALALSELKSGQSTLLNEMRALKTKLSKNDQILDTIQQRLSKIEQDCGSFVAIKTQVKGLETLAESQANQIAALTSRVDEAEDRARRQNLIFYGLADADGETWAQSEKKVIDHCASHLQLTVETRDIERAHRLGTFCSERKRPVIVKFSHFKERERVLVAGRRIKVPGISIAEDNSPSTRFSRKRLVDFGKSQNVAFKLRYNKLIIGNDTYIFDSTSQKVVKLGS